MITTRRNALTVLAAGLAAPAATAQGVPPSSPKDRPSTTAVSQVAGQYRSMGKQRDCTPYAGVAWITQKWRLVEVTWTVGDKTLRGQGLIDGRVVTVHYGDPTPAVYVAMPDGTLHGTWDDGMALEKLTPL